MSLRIFIAAALSILVSNYSLEGKVLILEDIDFPNIFNKFSRIFVYFQAQCYQHCQQDKKLKDIFHSVANDLTYRNSTVTFAQFSYQQQKTRNRFCIRKYSTLSMFLNGKRVDYRGQRSQAVLTNWILKRSRDAVSKLTLDNYYRLEKNNGVSIIYHGNLTAQQNSYILTDIAALDDYNTYYWVLDTQITQGFIEMKREFDKPLFYEGLDKGVQNWISQNQRPLILPFDQRTIRRIFTDKKIAVLFFNPKGQGLLLQAFESAAQQYSQYNGQPLLFIQVSHNNQRINDLANYIKIDPKLHSVVIVQPENQKKHIFGEQMTKERILHFFRNFRANEYKFSDEIQNIKKSKKLIHGEKNIQEQL